MTKRVKDKGQCKMPGCQERACWSGLCRACYSFMWYWKGKTPGQIMARIEAIERATNRMSVLMPPRVAKIKRRA